MIFSPTVLRLREMCGQMGRSLLKAFRSSPLLKVCTRIAGFKSLGLIP